MTFRVAHWDTLDDRLASQYPRVRYLSLLMASVMCLHFNMQEEDILEHTNGKCHLCTLQSTYRPLWNIDIHLITLLSILMSRYQEAHSNAKCHETALIVKLLIINVTQHPLQNRVSGIVSHVTLNTIANVTHLSWEM